MRRLLSLIRLGEEGALTPEYGLLLIVITAICLASLVTPILAFPWQ